MYHRWYMRRFIVTPQQTRGVRGKPLAWRLTYTKIYQVSRRHVKVSRLVRLLLYTHVSSIVAIYFKKLFSLQVIIIFIYLFLFLKHQKTPHAWACNTQFTKNIWYNFSILESWSSHTGTLMISLPYIWWIWFANPFSLREGNNKAHITVCVLFFNTSSTEMTNLSKSMFFVASDLISQLVRFAVGDGNYPTDGFVCQGKSNGSGDRLVQMDQVKRHGNVIFSIATLRSYVSCCLRPCLTW